MLRDEGPESDRWVRHGRPTDQHAKLSLERRFLWTFNEHFGDIQWEEADRVPQLIIETIPERVCGRARPSATPKRNSDRQNARIEHDKALLCA